MFTEVIFDLEVKDGLSRIKRAKDRIELRSLQYHNRVRNGYIQLAKQEPKRIKLIKVNSGKEEIHEMVKSHINRLLKI